ncbi:GNAT family N-acetyltransferase [Cryptosporangium arvum]|uniref:GNAT family N-acetyltransferase n=1 Tax=Cryptosporangium arvum TaxID=80871 RepID=UPI0012EE3D1D|nr:GNAT family N-acetyltransferase [Cryptosporangium arvum]
MTSRFVLPVREDVDLVLRERWTAESMHRLAVANIDRLRAWEPWAQGEQTLAALVAFDRLQLLDWVDGRCVPTSIRYRGELVGTISARIDPYHRTAELGYWIDAGAEGHGLVTACGEVLRDHVVAAYRVARLEIRAAVRNRRSRAVAERLGFTHEGTLRAALPVGADRHDIAVYGFVPTSTPDD